MPRKRQPWQAGDVFTIALSDGRCALGQVLSSERQALGSAGIALYARAFDSAERASEAEKPKRRDAFAILLATPDLLDNGSWPVIGTRPIPFWWWQRPYERFRRNGFVGAKIIGSANIREFVHAYFGLRAWDDWHDPKYLDGLLLSPKMKPGTLVYKQEK
jgi:hypothetical protein